MIIVTGNYQIQPDDRDRFLSSKRDQVEHTREETGCLEYAFSADADQPGLVRLIELWESMDDLHAHVQGLRSGPPQPQGVEVVSTKVAVYEATPATPPW